jgi:charged multivesicular body protein 4
MFAALFGRKPPPPNKKQTKRKTTESINVIREAITKLEKRENFLQKKIDILTKKVQAKVKKKNKKGALVCLKTKKMLEKQVETIMGKKLNLETQIMALEEAVMNVEVVDAMREGGTALNKQINHINIEDVDEMRDDFAEAQDRNEEINTALADPMGGIDLDDDDLLAELNELEDLNAAEELMDLPVINTNNVVQPMNVTENASAPQVIAQAPQQQIIDDDERELMAFMT